MARKLFSIIFAFMAITAMAQEKQDPQYPGGEEALRSFIQANLQSPPSVTQRRVYGTVFVNVEVNKNGEPTKVKVSKPSGYPDMDAEAVRVVKLIKEWQPGIKNGKPVKSLIIVPVDFQMPESYTVNADDVYPGGEEAMDRFFKMNTQYPQDALENNVYGRLFVHFTVDEEGKSKNVRVTAPSEYPSLDAEAVRLVKLVPRWNPAKVNGIPYEADFVVPVDFELPSQSSDGPDPSDMGNGQATTPQNQIDAGGTISNPSNNNGKNDGNNGNSGVTNQNNQVQPSGTTSPSTGITTTSQGSSNGNHPANGPVQISKMAQYPGGMSAMYAFLAKNVRYPAEEKRKGIEGQVVVRFLVNESGMVTKPTIQKGLTTNCNEEAIRLVKSMPRWQPAEDQNGRKVAMEMTATVYFSLNKPND